VRLGVDAGRVLMWVSMRLKIRMDKREAISGVQLRFNQVVRAEKPST
jgi:hypothetical protein